MPTATGTCPLTQQHLLDEYFMEHRTKVLDLAAFLDRLDRCAVHNAEDDFRLVSFRQALEQLGSRTSGRIQRVQMVFSDPTTEPLLERDQQNASGAYRPSQEAER